MSTPASHRRHASENEIQESGHKLAQNLHLAIRTVHTHDFSNDICVQMIRNLSETINAIFAERGAFDLHALSDFLYIGNDRIREDRTTHKYIRLLIDEFAQRGIGSLSVHDRVTPDDIYHLLELFKEFPKGDGETVNVFNERLSSFESSFVFGPVRSEENLIGSDVEEISKRERCKKAFFKALTVTEGLMKSVRYGKQVELRYAKRVVHQMVDLITDEEFTLLGLTTLKSYDNYTFHHSVNVSVYAIALGKRLGMNRSQLADLGVGALLHDLGKIKIPIEILHRKGALGPKDWETIKRHPVEGTKEIIRIGGFSILALRAMIGCFEHHMQYDGASDGYPILRAPYQPHMIGRAVAIADCFDAITTKRIYKDQPLPRDKALSFLVSKAGTKFDPVLMRVFVNMIGIYPIGTLVQLKSGRAGVVVGIPHDARLCHRPIVRPVTTETGIHVSTAVYPDIDLSVKGQDGRFPDEILQTIDGEAMGIETSQYFV